MIKSFVQTESANKWHRGKIGTQGSEIEGLSSEPLHTVTSCFNTYIYFYDD